MRIRGGKLKRSMEWSAPTPFCTTRTTTGTTEQTIIPFTSGIDVRENPTLTRIVGDIFVKIDAVDATSTIRSCQYTLAIFPQDPSSTTPPPVETGAGLERKVLWSWGGVLTTQNMSVYNGTILVLSSYAGGSAFERIHLDVRAQRVLDYHEVSLLIGIVSISASTTFTLCGSTRALLKE